MIRKVNETTGALNDLSPMPFGKYKGIPMQDVPVEYLHWYWHNATYPGSTQSYNYNQMMEYIEKSLDGLKMENKDLLWQKKTW